MYSSQDCGATPSLFLWSRDARPVRLVWTAPRPRGAGDEPASSDRWAVDDVLFGFSATALLLSPLARVAVAFLA